MGKCKAYKISAVLLALALLFTMNGPAALAGTINWTWSPDADTILINGQIVTVEDSVVDLIKSGEYQVKKGEAPFPIIDDGAIAIKDGKIIAVTDNRSVNKYKGKNTEVIDLGGKVVIPGLMDSHLHPQPLGHDQTYFAELTYANTKEDILNLVVQNIEEWNLGQGDWVQGRRWDEYKYPEMVTRWDLDEVTSGGQLVFLSRVYRGTIINTAVFELMGINDEDPATWPEWWLEDPENFTFEDKIFRAPMYVAALGETVEVPTGVFVGSKATPLVTVSPPALSFEEDVMSVKLGWDRMTELGIVAYFDGGSRFGYNVKCDQEALNRNWMKGRIADVLEGTFFNHTPEWIGNHLDGIKINNLGNEHLKWNGTKFYGDGGVGTRSAWLSEPFNNWQELEGEENYGVPVEPDYATREAQYRAALARGWDLHTHNTGDQAMRQTVDLYMKLMDEIKAGEIEPWAGRQAALQEQGKDLDLRWSIIHAYLPIEPETYVIEDMAKYGIIAAPNPVFGWQLGDSFVANLGEERMARVQPFRSYFEKGVIMASGSDYGVANHNPWTSIYNMLTRKTQVSQLEYGGPNDQYPDETVGIAEALISYTINGAYYSYDEDWRGSIEVGKAADLVVLDLEDIYELERNPELCFEMPERIVSTMVDGEVVFER